MGSGVLMKELGRVKIKNAFKSSFPYKGKVAFRRNDGKVQIAKMKNKPIHNRKHLESFRKELRENLTPAEAFLWKNLQKRQLKGRKFRRQHSIENFIVDFYCPEEKLIIELDGEIHKNATAEEKDRKRDKRLEELGFKVLRFENKMVFDFLPSILKEIEDNFE
ncbi:endonuclease domain-containing protein [Mesonia mobilis]|uniref:endonuclease domain-containing protein n=1 Tax=Mesonia mobilis TaxID=369791 RepID=UPI003216C0A9